MCRAVAEFGPGGSAVFIAMCGKANLRETYAYVGQWVGIMVGVDRSMQLIFSGLHLRQ